MKIRKCIVVVSHPRSGTHVTMDFIRRNFPAFNTCPKVWESASKLYLSLDDEVAPDRKIVPQISAKGCLIVQTHIGGISLDLNPFLVSFGIQNPIFIYPFRAFSKTIKSFAEFSNWDGAIRKFVDAPDRFFGTTGTVGEGAELHAEWWMKQRVAVLNVDNMIRDPQSAVEALGKVIGEEPKNLSRRLPRRKIGNGAKFSELWERLSGRESTAVIVPKQLRWTTETEKHEIDRRFQNVYSALEGRSIN